MTGYMFATGNCFGCKRLFTFNPELVPVIPLNGSREPICADCVALVNPRRVASGLSPIAILPGAYEPTECI